MLTKMYLAKKEMLDRHCRTFYFLAGEHQAYLTAATTAGSRERPRCRMAGDRPGPEEDGTNGGQAWSFPVVLVCKKGQYW